MYQIITKRGRRVLAADTLQGARAALALLNDLQGKRGRMGYFIQFPGV